MTGDAKKFVPGFALWDQYEAASKILQILRNTQPDKVKRVIESVTVVSHWEDESSAKLLLLPNERAMP